MDTFQKKKKLTNIHINMLYRSECHHDDMQSAMCMDWCTMQIVFLLALTNITTWFIIITEWRYCTWHFSSSHFRRRTEHNVQIDTSFQKMPKLDCESCKSNFKHSSSLSRHKKEGSVTKKRKFMCLEKDCGKNFIRNEHLIAHQDAVHENICAVCPKCDGAMHFGSVGRHLSKGCGISENSMLIKIKLKYVST